MEADKEKKIHTINPNARNLFEVSLDFLDKVKGEPPLLLDAGCGIGRTTEVLHQLGYKAIGIDISEEEIAYAKKTYPGNQYFQHDLNNRLPFEDGTFDIIFSNSVLQYIEWQKVIKEYKRVLKPNGQVLLIENLMGNPLAKVYRFIMKSTKGYKKHYVPLKHVDYKELGLFQDNFEEVEFKFCVLFSTMVQILPRTNKYGFKELRGKTRSSLVKLENKLLKRFPGLSKYCSKVIIHVKRPK